MAEKKVKKEKSKARKIIEWILFGVFGAACAFVLAANVSAMINKKKNYGQSLRFGVGTFVILTDSMEPEINPKDLIMTYKEDVNKLVDRLAKGETVDVTFVNIDVGKQYFEPDTPEFKKSNGGQCVYSGTVMTHRLREAHVDESIAYGEGKYTFVASGINIKDAETGEESYSRKGQYQIFTETQYLGTVKSVNPFMGRTMNFISSPVGLIILLLIPAAYLITVSAIDIFKAVKEQEEAGTSNQVSETSVPDNDRLSKISNSDRERLKNELLEEMIKEKKENKK